MLTCISICKDFSPGSLHSPAAVGDPSQQRLFHGDGLLRAHLLTAVALDALAVVVDRHTSALFACGTPRATVRA